uniref:Large ribosomal subunit protein mL50 n=1 Tax=Heterorhabditis bacteriophora TaxID=37862 RepID=A0A1I7XE22_HETBA
MRSTVAKCVRARGLLSSVFKKNVPPLSADGSTKLTKEDQEKLRSVLPGIRTDEQRPTSNVQISDYETNDTISSQIDMDSIRARGFMKYRYNYVPPANIVDVVATVAKQVLVNVVQDTTQINEFIFGRDNHLKVMILSALSVRLKHCPTNSQLMHLKTVEDISRFYAEPVENLTNYAKLLKVTTCLMSLY